MASDDPGEILAEDSRKAPVFNRETERRRTGQVNRSRGLGPIRFSDCFGDDALIEIELDCRTEVRAK